MILSVSRTREDTPAVQPAGPQAREKKESLLTATHGLEDPWRRVRDEKPKRARIAQREGKSHTHREREGGA